MYEINSVPTFIVPAVGKFVVLVSVISVDDPLLPAVSSARAPSKVDKVPVAPPQEDVPQP